MASSSSLLNFLSPLFPSSNTSLPPLSSSIPKFPTLNPLSSSTPTSNSLSLSSTNKNHEIPVIAKKEEEYPGELMAVFCPSLAFSNTLFFRSAYNVQVLVDENENEERLLNRFRREVMRAGVIQECKRRRFFENKQDEKKRKHREAAKRNSRRRRGPFRPFPGKEDAVKSEKKEDDEDNWEMPKEAKEDSLF